MRTKCVLALLVLLALAVPAAPAHAGGVVTVCDEAHLLAALAGGGTVTFTCSGTITLSAEIVIAADTTIDGSGQTVTISGNNAVRVLSVNSGVTLNLNGMTIADGRAGEYSAGGGIANIGTVIVSNSTFAGNSAHTGIGGGISNSGELTVVDSSFYGNTASDGGGIFNNSGVVSMSDSAFSGNNAVYGGGGAVYNYGTMTVSNSTFSGNSSDDGAGIFSVGSLGVNNSTFSGNSARLHGGGIYNPSGTATLRNTIIASSPSGGNCSGAITDGGGNLSYPDTTCPGINADPLLGPLQNNGGPTWTMPLGPGSAAIDAADDSICAAPPVNNRDQRGIVRPQGPHCDIGAVEQYCPSFVPPGTVGVEDIVAIANRWGWTNATPGWDAAYDLNGDDRIDIVDIMLVTRVWGGACS